MKIYLDNCCYNRPYDDQSQLRISLETQAKLYVQDLIKRGKVDLVSSYILFKTDEIQLLNPVDFIEQLEVN